MNKPIIPIAEWREPTKSYWPEGIPAFRTTYDGKPAITNGEIMFMGALPEWDCEWSEDKAAKNPAYPRVYTQFTKIEPKYVMDLGQPEYGVLFSDATVVDLVYYRAILAHLGTAYWSLTEDGAVYATSGDELRRALVQPLRGSQIAPLIPKDILALLNQGAAKRWYSVNRLGIQSGDTSAPFAIRTSFTRPDEYHFSTRQYAIDNWTKELNYDIERQMKQLETISASIEANRQTLKRLEALTENNNETI